MASGNTTRHGRMMLLLGGVGLALVLMPFLFWHQTWFGRALTEEEVGSYLHDEAHARKIQHALSQVADRIVRGDPAASRWYPRIAELAAHRDPIIRRTCAWVMGQENHSELFHNALLGMIKDRDLMVRRNAALALVRFDDASGRPELLGMLEPYAVAAPADGTLSMDAQSGQPIGAGALLARVRPAHGAEVDVRAPLSGHVDAVFRGNGAHVAEGERLFLLRPEQDQVWEALRGLYLVGEAEDLPEIEPYARGARSMPETVREQASLTTAAIRTRSERSPTR